MSKAKRVRPRLKYSPSEQALLDLIPHDGERITTKQLIDKRYGKELPFNARSIVTSTLSTLIRKVDRNSEDFVIKKSGQVGPRPQEVWVEKRHGVRARAC